MLNLIGPDKPANTRLYAIKSLGTGEQFNSVLPLVDIIYDENSEIKCQVIDSLRLIGDYRPENEVICLLKDPEPSVRYAAAFFCGDLKVKKAQKYLFELLVDENSKIRATAAWALGRVRPEKSHRKLVEALSKEHDPDVRKQISRAAGMESSLILVPSGTVKNIKQQKMPGVLPGEMSERMNDGDETLEADICLVVEGSYPYVSGGVSSWVHDLIRYFRELKFALVHIASTRYDIKEFKYEMPENVVVYNEIHLYDLPEAGKNSDRINEQEKQKFLNQIFAFISTIKEQDRETIEKLFRTIGVPGELKLNINDLVFTKQGWEFQKRFYDTFHSDLPFLEYTWSYRSIVVPVYNLLKAKLPPAKIYYPVLTGYAGLAAVAARITTGKPMVLTEHGIYHRERMMEINKAAWIYEVKQESLAVQEVFTGLKKIWMEMYQFFSYLTYMFSDRITTLFDDNSLIQVESGAEKDRIIIIPNGVDTSRFSHIGKKDICEKETFVVGLVGRVVAIKDIRTFIWAANKAAEQMPGRIRFRVMGAYDEENEYAEECFALVKMLNMEDYFEFMGKVRISESFVDLDLMVLTSISEGQPLALLEAMAAGIPCVSTNVGSCRELLNGRNDEEPSLGICGFLTGIYSPNETAEAIVRILQDPVLYRQMSGVAKERINRYYRREDVFEKYRNLFDSLMERI
jgi:polysaccharide biosynthesis protein PelF